MPDPHARRGGVNGPGWVQPIFEWIWAAFFGLGLVSGRCSYSIVIKSAFCSCLGWPAKHILQAKFTNRLGLDQMWAGNIRPNNRTVWAWKTFGLNQPDHVPSTPNLLLYIVIKWSSHCCLAGYGCVFVSGCLTLSHM